MPDYNKVQRQYNNLIGATNDTGPLLALLGKASFVQAFRQAIIRPSILNNTGSLLSTKKFWCSKKTGTLDHDQINKNHVTKY